MGGLFRTLGRVLGMVAIGWRVSRKESGFVERI